MDKLITPIIILPTKSHNKHIILEVCTIDNNFLHFQ